MQAEILDVSHWLYDFNFLKYGDVVRQRIIDYCRENEDLSGLLMYNSVLDFERKYLEECLFTASWGNESSDRTGTGVFRKQNVSITIPVYYQFPLLRGKFVSFKNAQTEFFWMILGRTDLNFLNKYGVKYWNEFALKDENGNKLDNLGPVYGKQLRHFGGGETCNKTVDQLLYVINELRTNPDSRRALFNLWNPLENAEMSLVPCHYSYHFTSIEYENKRYIDLHVNQRSADCFLGVPYDFVLFGLFLHFMSIFTGFIPRYIYCTFNDFHLYRTHLMQIRQHSDNYNTSFGLESPKNGTDLVHITDRENLPQIEYNEQYVKSMEFTNTKLDTKLTKNDLEYFLYGLDDFDYQLFTIKNYEKGKRFGKIEAPLAV